MKDIKDTVVDLSIKFVAAIACESSSGFICDMLKRQITIYNNIIKEL
jgi:hypothetical protein